MAVAEGMDGVAVNPASVAVRLPYSWNRWDFSFGFDFAIGGWLPETDFLNRSEAGEGEGAEVEQRSLLFGSVGLALQYDHAGVGASAEGQQQALSRSADAMAGLAPTDLTGNFGIIHGSVAYGFGDGQLVVGAGPRVTGVSLSRDSSSSLVSVAGVGFQTGVVFKPTYYPFRIGATCKSPVTPDLGSDGERSVQSVYSATAIALPWQVAVGAAVQIGARRLNPPLETAEARARPLRRELDRRADDREAELANAELSHAKQANADSARRLEETKARHEREEETDEGLLEDEERLADAAMRAEYLARPRFYLLVSSELFFLGPSPDSVGFGSFYQGRTPIERSGERFTLSPRLGLESEVIKNWLKLRVGSYLEPARVTGATHRIHGTFGFDLKLFEWDVFGLIGDFDSWRLSTAADAARQYLSTSFSIGFWH